MLTNRERKFLDIYRRNHNDPPTFLGMVGRLFFRSPYLLAQSLLWGTAYLFDAVDPRTAGIVVGISLGILIRDLAQFVRFVHIWPLIDSMIDWTKVDELSQLGSLSEANGPTP